VGERPFRQLIFHRVQHVQRALSCVSFTVVLTDGANLWLAGAPVRLAASRPLLLTVREEWRPEGGDGGVLARYDYRVTNLDGDELAAYHRHGGRHDYDHVHTAFGSFPNEALPTGEVPLELVLRLCIEQGVTPLRDDWDQVLRAED
jgi:hypothetical protein